MLQRYTCSVEDIERLRYPGVYRVKFRCGDVSIELEFHEKVMPPLKKGGNATIVLTDSREECLQHYFCGKGSVVSYRSIGETYRAVVSIGGFLLVLKSSQQLDLKPLDEVYTGVSVS
ncbi:hypothetical protein TCELL_0283 [Thermogladius calderae 1633]|uniref:DNA-directed RNA polymerase subunit Rpo8 n=1 Tax=Thermogladius calderae (strain DSM 22663 / VKM B-2946 / 1633) TaxID=1184251 RepID=I3TD70_THEC1|nr:DNA-directed RNA polymerase subunit G [Thermogladius calderae]AFK50708.1 hypothetical protein TCELL_0283 [Thermogladius calderae 1633]